MPAYWVARSRVIDQVQYKKYADQVPGIIAKFGGQVLARGGRSQILEGTDKFHRFVVIEFPRWSRASPVTIRRNISLLLRCVKTALAKWKPSWLRAAIR